MPASLTTQHGRAGLDVVDQGGHPGRLVLVEQADHPAGDPHAQRLRQRPDPPGVLGGHDIGAAQRVDQPLRRVGRLAQRRGTEQQAVTSAGWSERLGDRTAQPTIAMR